MLISDEGAFFETSNPAVLFVGSEWTELSVIRYTGDISTRMKAYMFGLSVISDMFFFHPN
jgi:hypothetical protein